ncbi:hypothetical protein ACEPAI_3508 [Sanghuangporus weigelae]
MPDDGEDGWNGLFIELKGVDDDEERGQHASRSWRTINSEGERANRLLQVTSRPRRDSSTDDIVVDCKFVSLGQRQENVRNEGLGRVACPTLSELLKSIDLDT